MLSKPNVVILQATGTNRDMDAAQAIELAGGTPTVLHINLLRENPSRLHTYQMVIIPGGFSYGDALGAGRLLAHDLRWLFQETLARFIVDRKPVIGICNGFQALVKSGWLPGPPDALPRATLARNASNQFECRWVYLAPNPHSSCVFTRELTEPVQCPVAHGEGRFIARDVSVLDELNIKGQVALTYAHPEGKPVRYPENPNGSDADIAGICNQMGNVFGLMPHPENHIIPEQHPRAMRDDIGGSGLRLFQNGLKYAMQM